ncbi:MAG: glycoside hydrolase family 15 protein [Hahellaceae bacterium]|nr:glycoside hydrolase family 15 protein [Hahellaceae bacterium]
MQAKSSLDMLYQQVQEIILSRQHPVTGLLPASTANTVHGNYQDAWVRDNVYSIVCAWAVALACRRQGQTERQDRLSQATIKLMRGLLQSMMRQAAKVERFKRTQNRLDALHAKYDTATGLEVVADDAWGHLQLDATSLFLLMLAQMTRSGLRIVTTLDEVEFVQNLIYYISTAYRTPDYGIWERGNKINDGKTEINASSLGMAKSALLALDGLNLFGAEGSQEAIAHVIGDAVSHARTTLATLLPRESLSKEVDAALLSVIGFPAFAVGDEERVRLTRAEILAKLSGRYGCKRFLLDGHQTALEDTSRVHYEHSELVNFENIESEWPLFFCYLYLNALFDGDATEVAIYRARLDALTVDVEGRKLLPELYFVPRDQVEAEKAHPGSQTRMANENVPLVWAQSLYITGQLLDEGWLVPDDLDPVGIRQRRSGNNETQMALVVLAESEATKTRLAESGVIAESLDEIGEYRVIAAPHLVDVYTQVGANAMLGLTGRPVRSLQSLTTSQTYRINGVPYLSLSWIQSRENDYRLHDAVMVRALLRREIGYILQHWFYPEVAVFTFLVTDSLASAQSSEELFEVLRGFQLRAQSIKVGYASANLAMRASRCNLIEIPGLCVVPFTHPSRRPRNIEENVQFMTRLKRLAREKMPQLLKEELGHYGFELQSEQREVLFSLALASQNWWLVRYCMKESAQEQGDLAEAITWITARHITIVVGEPSRSLRIDSLFDGDVHRAELTRLLANPVERALVQELLVSISSLVRTEPVYFEGVRTLELHRVMEALLPVDERTEHLSRQRLIDQLGTLSPGEISQRTVSLLSTQRALYQQEIETHFTFTGGGGEKNDARRQLAESTDWLEWRHARGLMPRFDATFLRAVWKSLAHCSIIEFSDAAIRGSTLHCEPVRSSMTAGEEGFAQLIDGLIGHAHPPYFRTACVEVLDALAGVCMSHRDAHFPQPLVLAEILEAAALRHEGAMDVQEGHSRFLDLFLEVHPDRVRQMIQEELINRMSRHA